MGPQYDPKTRRPHCAGDEDRNKYVFCASGGVGCCVARIARATRIGTVSLRRSSRSKRGVARIARATRIGTRGRRPAPAGCWSVARIARATRIGTRTRPCARWSTTGVARIARATRIGTSPVTARSSSPARRPHCAGDEDRNVDANYGLNATWSVARIARATRIGTVSRRPPSRTSEPASPALRGRRGSELGTGEVPGSREGGRRPHCAGDEDRNLSGADLTRANLRRRPHCAGDEDRNCHDGSPVVCWWSRRRPHCAGDEDRNTIGEDGYQCDLLARRPHCAGDEDRNETLLTDIVSGRIGVARIARATRIGTVGIRTVSVRLAPGVARIARATRIGTRRSGWRRSGWRRASPALRGRRGSEPSGDMDVKAVGAGVARIARATRIGTRRHAVARTVVRSCVTRIARATRIGTARSGR